MTTISEGPLSEPELMELLGAEQEVDCSKPWSELRHPLVAKAILTQCDASKRRIAAFTRELSYSGVGLLHHQEISPGAKFEIELILRDVCVQRKAECLGCTNLGHGWFQSGWRFE